MKDYEIGANKAIEEALKPSLKHAFSKEQLPVLEHLMRAMFYKGYLKTNQ